MSKLNLLNKKPDVLCEMPTVLVERGFKYATRGFPTTHLDTGAKFYETYTCSGVYKDATGGTLKNLVKALNVVFDCDLVDVVLGAEGIYDVVYPNMRDFYAQAPEGATVFSSGGEQIAVARLRATKEEALADRTGATALVKYWLTAQPQEELTAMVRGQLPQHVTFLAEQLNGKLPNVITYSGTGYHLHYFLAETEGWGAEALAELQYEGGQANVNELKAAYKRVNAKFGAKFGFMLDEAMSSLGTAVMREVGTLNLKFSTNPKTVTRLFEGSNLVASSDSRISLSDFPTEEVKEKPARTTKAKPAPASAEKRKPGRPKKAKANGTPVKVEAEATVTLEDGTTLTLEQLASEWSDLKGTKHKQDGRFFKKVKMRLDWVSSGSINSWANRYEDDGAIFFLCDVEKYSNIDPEAWFEGSDGSGKLVGHWVYRPGLDGVLERDDKGKVTLSHVNIQAILRDDPTVAGHIRFNSRLKRVEITAELYQRAYGPSSYSARTMRRNQWMQIEDLHLTYLGALVEKHVGKYVTPDRMRLEVNFFAAQNDVDPAHAWIETLVWDGKRRVDTWLPDLLRIAPTHPRYELYAAYGRSAMLSILRSTYTVTNNPVMLQLMLVLVGEQGDGKSTLAATLGAVDYIGRQYYSESELNFDKPADLYAQLRGKLVAEVPELAALGRNDMNLVKSFITKGQESQRQAYDRYTTSFDRTTYLVGTTNDRVFLRDTTGNRRFCVVDLYTDFNSADGMWDLEGLIEAIPQLYAEAFQRAVLGYFVPTHRDKERIEYNGVRVESWNLTASESAQQALANGAFEIASQEDDAVITVLSAFKANGQTQLSSTDIREALRSRFGLEIKNNQLFSSLMVKAGWENKRIGSDRKRYWCFVERHRPNPVPPPPPPPSNGGGWSSSEQPSAQQPSAQQPSAQKYTYSAFTQQTAGSHSHTASNAQHGATNGSSTEEEGCSACGPLRVNGWWDGRCASCGMW